MRFIIFTLLVVFPFISCSTSSQEQDKNKKIYTTYFETNGDFETLFNIEEFTADSIFHLNTEFRHDYTDRFGSASSKNSYHNVFFYISIPPHTVYRVNISLINEFFRDNYYEIFDHTKISSNDSLSTGKVIASLYKVNGLNRRGEYISKNYTSQSGKLNVFEIEKGNIRGEFEVVMRLSEDSEVQDLEPRDDALTVKGSFQTKLR